MPKLSINEELIVLEICMIVCASRNEPINNLFLPSRCKAATCQTRQICMYLSVVELNHSYTGVGEFFYRDRTTVAHACKVIEDKRDHITFDEELSKYSNQIRVHMEKILK